MSQKPFTILRFLKNIGLMLGIGAVLLVFFFYVYLPASTNHSETITVPDVEGMAFEAIDDMLTNRDLRFQVMEDSGYAEDMQPLAILSQNPKPGSKVKENRMVYLTLNAKVPPQVRMPNLIGTDSQNAEDILESNGLKLGNISYVPDRRLNAVIEQKMNDENLEANTLIYKGSVIDLVIGNGEGNTRFAMPNFIGRTLEEAKFQIRASDLKLTEIYYIKNDTVDGPVVYKQLPPVGREIRTDDLVEIWINQEDSDRENEQEGNSL